MTIRSTQSLRSVFENVGGDLFRPTLLVIIIFLGTYATSAPQASNTDHDWIRSEIYFGQTDRNGKPISNAAWLRFVNKSITSVFPDGFTIIRATGEWTDQKKHHQYSEPSRVLIVVYPKAKAQAADEAIRKLSSQFLREFNEEAVLRVDSQADVAFYKE